MKSTRPRLACLNKFCIFTDKSPSEIILEHHEDQKLEPIKRTNIGKNQMNAFFKYLIGEKNPINDKINMKAITVNSARQYVYSKIASFYKRNGVPIFFEKNEIPSENKGVREVGVWRNGERRISKDQKKDCIKRILNTLKTVRDKSILLSKISSGMDDVDLFNLKVKDIKNGYYEEFNISYITGYRQKCDDCYYQTFFNSEASDMISLYLKEREKRGEILNDDTPLFVSEKSPYGVIKRSAFSDNLKQACKTLELVNITPKSFRRWFNTELKGNSIEAEIVERMLGHKGTVSNRYNTLFSDQESFVELYVVEIEAYTLLGNGNRKLSEMDKKVEKLEVENEALKNEIIKTNESLTKLTNLVKAIINQEKDIQDKLALIEEKKKESEK